MIDPVLSNDLAAQMNRLQVGGQNIFELLVCHLQIGNWWVYGCSVDPNVDAAKPLGHGRDDLCDLISFCSVSFEKTGLIRRTPPFLEVCFALVLMPSNENYSTASSPEPLRHGPTEYTRSPDHDGYLVL